MENDYSNDLARVRIERAKELLQEAVDLLAKGSYKSANNRAFYSIEKSIKALLALCKTDAGTHSGVIKQFNYYYIYQGDGTFTADDYKVVSRANQVRDSSDYDDFYIASKSETEQQVKDARCFYEKAEAYVKGVIGE